MTKSLENQIKDVLTNGSAFKYHIPNDWLDSKLVKTAESILRAKAKPWEHYREHDLVMYSRYQRGGILIEHVIYPSFLPEREEREEYILQNRPLKLKIDTAKDLYCFGQTYQPYKNSDLSNFALIRLLYRFLESKNK